jgi:hypothetical protein
MAGEVSRRQADEQGQKTMMNIVPGLIGIALMAGFLGIMVTWIKEIPLIIIAVGVMALLAYDLWQTIRGSGNTPYRR